MASECGSEESKVGGGNSFASHIQWQSQRGLEPDSAVRLPGLPVHLPQLLKGSGDLEKLLRLGLVSSPAQSG